MLNHIYFYILSICYAPKEGILIFEDIKRKYGEIRAGRTDGRMMKRKEMDGWTDGRTDGYTDGYCTKDIIFYKLHFAIYYQQFAWPKKQIHYQYRPMATFSHTPTFTHTHIQGPLYTHVFT